ncbi:hypothetical protein ACPA9J_13575 [Pseudomonas aeruginosa]
MSGQTVENSSTPTPKGAWCCAIRPDLRRACRQAAVGDRHRHPHRRRHRRPGQLNYQRALWATTTSWSEGNCLRRASAPG